MKRIGRHDAMLTKILVVYNWSNPQVLIAQTKVAGTQLVLDPDLGIKGEAALFGRHVAEGTAIGSGHVQMLDGWAGSDIGAQSGRDMIVQNNINQCRDLVNVTASGSTLPIG